MTKASDNIFPKILASMNASAPAAPSDSSWKVYAKPGGIYARSSNAEVGPFGTGSGSATFVGCLATRTTSQSINNDTATAIAFNAADINDSDAFHDTSTNNSRITIPSGKDGYYNFTANIIWSDASTTGYRRAYFLKNGSTIYGWTQVGQTGGSYYGLDLAFGPIAMVATDYMEVIVRQTTGGAYAVAADVVPVTFGAVRVGT